MGRFAAVLFGCVVAAVVAEGVLRLLWLPRNEKYYIWSPNYVTTFVPAPPPKLEELPPLESALDEYDRNIEAIVREARRRNLRIVLLTQPALWKPAMTAEEDAALWLGWSDEARQRDYYGSAALARAMEAYNKRLLATCTRLGAECIDLAARLPRTLEVFYDDVHFNEPGAQRVAAELVTYLRERAPFAAAPR